MEATIFRERHLDVFLCGKGDYFVVPGEMNFRIASIALFENMTVSNF